MTQAFIQALPSLMGTDRIRALASFLREVFVPVDTATTITLRNHPMPDFTDVYKAGLLLDPTTDYTIAGNVVTLTDAANGTDTYQVKYYFRASA